MFYASLLHLPADWSKKGMFKHFIEPIKEAVRQNSLMCKVVMPADWSKKGMFKHFIEPIKEAVRQNSLMCKVVIQLFESHNWLTIK